MNRSSVILDEGGGEGVEIESLEPTFGYKRLTRACIAQTPTHCLTAVFERHENFNYLPRGPRVVCADAGNCNRKLLQSGNLIMGVLVCSFYKIYMRSHFGSLNMNYNSLFWY